MTFNEYFQKLIIILIFISSATLANASCVFSSHVKIKEVAVGTLISWTTIEEVNNDYFILQKSTDGVEFTTIMVIKGAVNSQEERSYKYLDSVIGEKQIYYRLLLQDLEGEYEYTPEVVLTRSVENNIAIEEMSSFEVEKFFSITLNSAVKAELKYDVKDANGQFFNEGVLPVEIGMNALTLDFGGYEAGKYQITILHQDEKEIANVFKLDASKIRENNVARKEGNKDGGN